MAVDVLIAGAGPAGAVAALVLARAGVRVRLFDRERFPRDKLCGDTINPGTMAMLERLDAGLSGAIRAKALPVTGMTVTGPGQATVAADYPDRLEGMAIARRDLDLMLLERAIAAGAEFIPGIRVRRPIVDAEGGVTGVHAAEQSRQFNMNARVVIAADGRRSSLAFALSLARCPQAPRRWACGAYFTDVADLTTRGEMHIRRDGYIGVAPLPGRLANVCVVRELFRLKSSGGGRKVIADVIAGDPLLRARFAQARQASPIVTLGPLAVEALAAGCPGLLLAGDAAGFVDPMTGDGMRFAIRGGELAAAAAIRELQTGQAAWRALGENRAREFSGKWRINRTLRALVASPRSVSMAARVASHWPAPVRYLVGVAGDIHLVPQCHQPV